MAHHLQHGDHPVNALLAAALVALLVWFGTLILAGAVAEWRQTRALRRQIVRRLAPERPAEARSPVEAWHPRTPTLRRLGGR